ncbi:MAG: MBOAT family protein [Bacteroidetes bacterium]|nr:MBOAT family protein [Bacteroidota bacterium]
MLFNSVEFLIFFVVVFCLYWLLANKIALQNILLLIASYFFYGWWDWRFLSLIFISSVLDFFVGMLLGRTEHLPIRKILISVSITFQLGLLGFFKYFNFFIDSFVQAFDSVGITLNIQTLNVILPVGISFYTFQTMSYTLDVYNRKIKSTDDFISFMAFVSFFPQLVAGPIERARNLLPQFGVKREFSYEKAVDGMRQILWGFFKKIAVADVCAEQVNIIFANSAHLHGSHLIMGGIFFAFQIYGDFSGYSDIAVGTARLFGFNLMRNFANPYFARDIAEFWRRWHISLTTWFRDYLYIPLGGSKHGMVKSVRNTFLVFVISGFWHGANWTFIAWGMINAVYFIPLLVTGQNRKNLDVAAADRIFPSLKEMMQITLTFFLTVIAWIFFRANNLSHAFAYLKNIFTSEFFNVPVNTDFWASLPAVLIMIAFEWMNRKREHGLCLDPVKSRGLRWAIYYLVFFVLIFLGSYDKTEFIYFQF